MLQGNEATVSTHLNGATRDRWSLTLDSQEQCRDRQRLVRRILLIVLGLNLAVAAIKAAAGWASGSTALVADGAHSLFDGVGNVIGLVAVGWAMRPPDSDHPYGHRKGEVVAALAIGLVMLLGMVELARQSWTHYITGGSTNVSTMTILAAVSSLVVSGAVTLGESYYARKHRSEILAADASHTASDVLATIAVLAGLLAVKLGFPAGDLIATLVVLVFIGIAVLRIFKRATDVLMDMNRISPEQVAEIASEVTGVISVHAIRSRGMPGHVQLDMHVTFEPQMTLQQAGERMVELKLALHESLPDVSDIVVQLEPHLPEHLPVEEPA